MNRLPLFPVTVVGSWPRPAYLLEAQRRGSADLEILRERACAEAIRDQVEAGADMPSDGEQRRDNFYSFLCERLDGLQLLSMADLLNHVEDKAAFEGLLRALDVPAFAIKNPIVVGKLARRGSLVGADLAYARQRTDLPVKVTLPGPYLLSRSIWVKSLSEAAYPTREALNDDIVRIFREELRQLVAAGADFVQFDEPVLSELVFAGKSATRTFMCAALAAKSSPEEELELAIELINRVTQGFSGPTIGMHVCRGNWSTQEDVLLSGSYAQLMPSFQRMRLDQLVLEYATPRAGPLEVLADLPKSASLGLGAVNPRTTELERPEQVAERVRDVARFVAPERIYLNPDCGFGTFAERPVASRDLARAKLEVLAQAAQILRKG
ncbi:MAG TPA: cobalamin-independent methionine synthase II family protein [Planctomycetota bacterium]|nr:cobalamin-independent methionine synthase II family protein [Planctomycetota bacterium]